MDEILLVNFTLVTISCLWSDLATANKHLLPITVNLLVTANDRPLNQSGEHQYADGQPLMIV